MIVIALGLRGAAFGTCSRGILNSDDDFRSKEVKLGTRFMEMTIKIFQQDKDIQKIIEESGDDILESCYISIRDIPSDKI